MNTGKDRDWGFWGVVAVIIMVGILPTSVQAGPAKVSWNFHTVLGAGDPYIEEGERWAVNEIKKATGGELEINIFEKSTLGFAGPDIWEVVSKGLLPIAEMWAPHVQGRYPWITALELPFLYDCTNLECTDRLMGAMWDLFAKPLAQDNLVLLGWSMAPFGRGFQVNKPLNSDPKTILKGMKIRVSGPTPSWAAEALGATPVMMDYAEVYEAGMRGLVDGMDSGSIKSFLQMKYHEVFKKILLLDKKNWNQLQFGSTTWMIVANREKLQSLPAEWQKVVKDRFREAGPRLIRPYLTQNQEVMANIEKYGMSYMMVPPETLSYMKTQAPAYWDKWRKKAGPYGAKVLEEALVQIKNCK